MDLLQELLNYLSTVCTCPYQSRSSFKMPLFLSCKHGVLKMNKRINTVLKQKRTDVGVFNIGNNYLNFNMSVYLQRGCTREWSWGLDKEMRRKEVRANMFEAKKEGRLFLSSFPSCLPFLLRSLPPSLLWSDSSKFRC